MAGPKSPGEAPGDFGPAMTIGGPRRMSLQNRVLSWALRRWIKPKSLRQPDIAASRAMTGRVPFGAKLPRGWQLRIEHAADLAGEWIEPVAADHPARERTILYLHGGGYVAMSPRTHRSITSRLASWSGARLFALDYRLAPEHPFPAALDDAVAAYRALIAGGTPASRIVVAGDSAGAAWFCRCWLPCAIPGGRCRRRGCCSRPGPTSPLRGRASSTTMLPMCCFSAAGCRCRRGSIWGIRRRRILWRLRFMLA